jgi:glycosyltransferase involved in cell wall biosynthesis
MACQTIAGATGALVLGERLIRDVSFCIPQERTFVLPNGLPDQANDWQSQRSPHKRGCRILYLANFSEKKGAWEFLQMAKALTAKAPQTHFVLAGSPKEKIFYQKMLKFRETENLSDRVEILEGVYGEAKARLFQESDLFVYPTQRDAAPLVLLEAMQWGLPVVSSFEGSIPEIVVDGETGFLVDPKDISQLTTKVLNLIEDSELRNRLGYAGRKRFKDYYTSDAYQENVKQCLSFFDSIINNN